MGAGAAAKSGVCGGEMGAMRSIFLLLWSLIFGVSGLWPQDSDLPAIPESVQAPVTVDLAWKVLPHRVVEDSFGRRVADRFFAVEIHIGNNTGHDLLVSGFYFRPPGRSTRRVWSPTTRIRWCGE